MNIKRLMHSILVASLLATCQTAQANAYPSKFDYFMGITSTTSVGASLYSRTTFSSQIDKTWKRYSEIAPSTLSLPAKLWLENIFRKVGVSESLLEKMVYFEGTRGEIVVFKGAESVYFEIPCLDAEFLNAVLEKDLETLPADQLQVLHMIKWLCAREAVHLRKTQEWGFSVKRGDEHILNAVRSVIGGVTYHVARGNEYGKLSSYGIAIAANLLPSLIFAQASSREEYQCDIQACDSIETLKAALRWLETRAPEKAINFLATLYGTYDAAKAQYDAQSIIAMTILPMPHHTKRIASLRAHLKKFEAADSQVLVVAA